jgi:predicted DNA-binding protein (MmcQ/YjbR family)
MFRDIDPFWGSSRAVRGLYRKLAVAVRRIGPFDVKPTKTSMNLVRGAVFLAVEPQLKGLRLTVKSEKPIDSPRILSAGHMTRTRWHNDLKLMVGQDVDSELFGWIEGSYDLCELPAQPQHKLRPRAQPPVARRPVNRKRTK